MSVIASYQEQMSFNSTMVRLKDSDLKRIERSIKGFNSTMVRLKVLRFQVFLLVFLRFNSTMVRLKAQLKTQRHRRNLFQFHYGTIKSSFFSCCC